MVPSLSNTSISTRQRSDVVFSSRRVSMLQGTTTSTLRARRASLLSWPVSFAEVARSLATLHRLARLIGHARSYLLLFFLKYFSSSMQPMCEAQPAMRLPNRLPPRPEAPGTSAGESSIDCVCSSEGLDRSGTGLKTGSAIGEARQRPRHMQSLSFLFTCTYCLRSRSSHAPRCSNITCSSRHFLLHMRSSLIRCSCKLTPLVPFV
jgi:hypothetical protein